MVSEAESQALKAKQAEIEMLKQQIREKSLQRKNASYSVAKPYTTSSRKIVDVGLSMGYGNRFSNKYHRATSMVFNRPAPVVQELPQTQLLPDLEQELTPLLLDLVPVDLATNEAPAYISRVSRGGMTLVSQQVYERDQPRYEALQMSLQARQTKYAEMERQRIEQRKKLAEQRRAQAIKARISKNRTKTDDCDRIEIEGDKFSVTSGGCKLVAINLTATPIPEKSKSVIWNDMTFKRLANGNLKAKGVKYVFCDGLDATCTNISRTPSECRYFTRIGICQKGSQCKYRHTKSRIRICRQYLLGSCFDRNCLLSHESNDSNTPLCMYYLQGNCTNSKCRFIHEKPQHYDDENYEIWTCRQFSIGGYCQRGKLCPMLHLNNCPDFEEEGTCPRGKSCTLTHQITKRTQELMVTPSNKYERGIDDVVVEEQLAKKIISSYTIDPKLLVTTIERGKYDIYIDKVTKAQPVQDSQFVISISDSDSDSSDGLEDNEDYVKFAS